MGFQFVMSLSGIVKIVEEVMNFIAMICVAAGGNSSEGTAFLVANVTALLFTAFFIVLYMFNFHVKFSLPWCKIQFFLYIVWMIFYLIVSCLVIAWGNGAYIAGGVFGLFAIVAYLVDAYDNFIHLDKIVTTTS